MSKESEKFRDAQREKYPNAEKVLRQAVPMSAWDYGFHDGWDSALNSKFDGREALVKWRQGSKHVFCPCTRAEACKSTCPHGNSFMSGVCIWCIDKFNEIEAELEPATLPKEPEVVKEQLFDCRYDQPWVGRCNRRSLQEFCEEHRQNKCFECGEQATRGCDMTSSLVCGMPECDKHTHHHRY